MRDRKCIYIKERVVQPYNYRILTFQKETCLVKKEKHYKHSVKSVEQRLKAIYE